MSVTSLAVAGELLEKQIAPEWAVERAAVKARAVEVRAAMARAMETRAVEAAMAKEAEEAVWDVAMAARYPMGFTEHRRKHLEQEVERAGACGTIYCPEARAPAGVISNPSL